MNELIKGVMIELVRVAFYIACFLLGQYLAGPE